MNTKAPALIEAIQAATQITDHALARKLGISVTRLVQWIAGSRPPSEQAQKRLVRFYRRTQASTTEVDPSVKEVTVPSAFVHGDGITYVQTMPDACVDLVLSDIPYGIGLESWDVLHDNTNSAYLGRSAAQESAGGAFERRRKPINGWSAADRAIPQSYHLWCAQWARQWLRVLKPGGSAFIFAGRRLAPRCAVALEEAGFNLRDQLAWIRPRALFRAQRLSTVFKRRGDLHHAQRWSGWRLGNLRPTFEPILWLAKPYASTLTDNVLAHGQGAFNLDAFSARFLASDNVIRCGFEPGERGYHPAQKPIELLMGLIELTTSGGQLVLDPFAGSGSTVLASRRLGRRCVAVERDAEIYAKACSRLDSHS